MPYSSPRIAMTDNLLVISEKNNRASGAEAVAKGRTIAHNLHDRSGRQRNQARFVNIPLAKGLAAGAQIASR